MSNLNGCIGIGSISQTWSKIDFSRRLLKLFCGLWRQIWRCLKVLICRMKSTERINRRTKTKGKAGISCRQKGKGVHRQKVAEVFMRFEEVDRFMNPLRTGIWTRKSGVIVGFILIHWQSQGVTDNAGSERSWSSHCFKYCRSCIYPGKWRVLHQALSWS